MTNLLEFKLDNGESAFMQIEESDNTQMQSSGRQRVSRGATRSNDDETQASEEAQQTFSAAIASIAPVANTLLTSLKDINTPDEIGLEFGVKFNGKVGVIFTSVESEASFKVNITWRTPPNTQATNITE